MRGTREFQNLKPSQNPPNPWGIPGFLELYFSWSSPTSSLKINWVLTVFLASLFVGVSYCIHWLFLSPLPPVDQISGFFNLDVQRFKLFESGPIPYFILWAFWFGLTYLVQIRFSPFARRYKDYINQRYEQLQVRWGSSSDLPAVIALKDEILQIDEENIFLSFVPVKWSEWTLPLLGFLGTVVGVGQAIGGMKEGIRIVFKGGEITPTAFEFFTDGFRGLAVAFDTTFLGLAGLIIVGGLHLFVKRRLADGLVKARETFTNLVAGLTPPDADITVVTSINNLEAKIEKVENDNILFRNHVKLLVEQVIEEDPNFDHIKKVLFKFIVEFNSVHSGFVSRTQHLVNDKLKADKLKTDWHFTCITVSSSPTMQVVAGIKTSTKNYLLFSDIKGEGSVQEITYNPKNIILSDDGRILLAIKDSDGNLIIQPTIKLENGSDGHRELSIKMSGRDHFLQMPKQNLLLIIHQTGLRNEVKYISSTDIDSSEIHLLRAFDPDVIDWLPVSAYGNPQTLILVGKLKNSTQWQVELLELRQNLVDKNTSNPSEHLEIRSSNKLLLQNIQPKQVEMLAENQLLIVDTKGQLHYWDLKRPTPTKLNHEPFGDCKILPGMNGWIGVAAAGNLSMWRVRHGDIAPYEKGHKGFTITGIDVKYLQSTSDGRYIIGASDQNIIAWEFPRYYLDGL
jgi:hypothetical protein